MKKNTIQAPLNQLERTESSRQEKERLEKEEENQKKRFAGAYSQNEVNQYEEGIDAAKRMPFIILFPCAIISDFADLIPVVGTIGKFIALPIIWYSYYITGTTAFGQDEKYKIEVSWKIRLLFRALGIIDIIPFINALPLTTLSVFVIWNQTRKQMAERQKEMEEWEQQRDSIH